MVRILRPKVRDRVRVGVVGLGLGLEFRLGLGLEFRLGLGFKVKGLGFGPRSTARNSTMNQ